MRSIRLAVVASLIGAAAGAQGSLGGVGAATVSGAYVQNVPKGSAGERAGLQPGDLVYSFNGSEVHGVEDVQRLLQATKPGQTVQMLVLRGGKAFQAPVRLERAGGAAPVAAQPAPAPVAKAPPANDIRVPLPANAS